MCEFKHEQESGIRKHIENNHLVKVNVQLERTEEQVKNISCDKCQYKCRFNIQLKQHEKKKHHEGENNSLREYCCDGCDFKSFYLTDLWKHKVLKHTQEDYNQVKKSPADYVLNIIAEQNADIMEILCDLTKGLKRIIQPSRKHH